ncbi:hypothetical protein [Streptomyces smyrnaeus]|uniref:hypothetical protein n=1 Tax=Streptomyces smyrnaeus TaxID=1387713 RepID=UPI0033FCB341
MQKSPAHRRAAAALTCVAALGLFGTACSDSSGDKDAKGSGTAAGKTDEDKAVAFRKCLRDNGLDVGEPKGEGQGKKGGTVAIGGGNKAKVEKAMKACRDKAPNGGAQDLSQADKDKMLKFAKCMRDNGYNMPDPEFGEGGMQKSRKVPKGEERKKFDKANKACKGLSK